MVLGGRSSGASGSDDLGPPEGGGVEGTDTDKSGEMKKKLQGQEEWN